jgi:hypothetical protein
MRFIFHLSFDISHFPFVFRTILPADHRACWEAMANEKCQMTNGKSLAVKPIQTPKPASPSRLAYHLPDQS